MLDDDAGVQAHNALAAVVQMYQGILQGYALREKLLKAQLEAAREENTKMKAGK